MRVACPPVIFVSLMLISCGGGGGGGAAPTNAGQTPNPPSVPAPPEPPPPTPVNNSPRVVDYYGDSTVWGCQSGTSCTQVSVTPPEAFDQQLTTMGVSFAHTVRNEGVNSTDACQLLNGNDGVHPEWSIQMNTSNATHVIINHGINDSFRNSLSDYRQCLTSLAQIAQANNKQVIFETPNPASGSDVAPYAQAMRDVAASIGIPVIDQFAYLSARYPNPADITPDGLHPSTPIYVEKGQFAARAFQQACGNFACTATVVAN